MSRPTVIWRISVAAVVSAAFVSSMLATYAHRTWHETEAHQNNVRPSKSWRPIAQFDQTVVRECSGIVASRRYPGVYWTHSDSFNEPMIFAVNLEGRVLSRIWVDAVNVDWEDIAIDDQGHLYIGDIGNNAGWLKQRTVYRINEPDPFVGEQQRVTPDKTISYSYSRERFNAEGLFARAGRLYVVSKHDRGRSRIYRLVVDDRGDGRLVEVCVLPGIVVTGADVSIDGIRLLLSTMRGASVYVLSENDGGLEAVKESSVSYPVGSMEACCWLGRDVVLVNEKGLIYRVSRADFLDRTRFDTPHGE